MSEAPLIPVEQCLLVGYYDVVSSLLSVRYSAAITIQTAYRRHLLRQANKAAALDNQSKKDRVETADLSLKATLKTASCSQTSTFAEKNIDQTSLSFSVVADVSCSPDLALRAAEQTEVIEVMVEQDATQTAEKCGRDVTCARLEATDLNNRINELAEQGVFKTPSQSDKASALAEHADKAFKPAQQQTPALVVRGQWIKIVEAAKAHMSADLREARVSKTDKSTALVRGLNHNHQKAVYVSNSNLPSLRKTVRRDLSRAKTNKNQHAFIYPLHFPNFQKLTKPSDSSSEQAKLASIWKSLVPPNWSGRFASTSTADTPERSFSYIFISPHARASRRPRVKMRGSSAC
jgi:hypothetical protein